MFAVGVLLVAMVAGVGLLPAGATGSGSLPAQSAGKCLYMVRDVHHAGDIYTGDFLVLKLTGNSLAGYGGAFYSEAYNVKGVISGSAAKLAVQDPYGTQWTNSVRRWIASENRLAGWKRVSLATMRKYSGGYVPIKGRLCG